MARVCLIEDSEDIQRFVVDELKDEFEFRAAGTLKEARSLLAEEKFDLILLDVALPDGNGFDFCRDLRGTEAYRHLPVVFLSSSGDVQAQTQGFALGADDYVTKPFDPTLLKARLQARVRRAARELLDPQEVHGGFRFDLVRGRACALVEGEDIDLNLTPSELRIFLLLARAPGRLFSREEILEAVKDPGVHISVENVYSHAYTLRKKLGGRADRIESIPRMGYRFRER